LKGKQKGLVETRDEHQGLTLCKSACEQKGRVAAVKVSFENMGV